MILTTVILSLWLINPAGAATAVGALGPGHAALAAAPAEIRELVRAGAEAEIKILGSLAGRSAGYVMALDGSPAAAQALARRTLHDYFAKSPLLGPARLLDGPGPRAEAADCEPQLESRGFARDYDLAHYERNWQTALKTLFPPGKSPSDYSSDDAEPFTSSKLKNAFELAQVTGLEDEMMTTLQLMLAFDQTKDLIDAVSSLDDDRLLARIGFHLLARAHSEPIRRFSVIDIYTNLALDAFALQRDPKGREEFATMIGDLADDVLSPEFQRAVDRHFSNDAESKAFYLMGKVGKILRAAGRAGQLRYAYTSETYRDYADQAFVGLITDEKTRVSIRRLISYAASVGVTAQFPEVMHALTSIGDQETLRRFGDEAKSSNENELALRFYASAGDMNGVRRAFLAGNWLAKKAAPYIKSAINDLADDQAIADFIEFLGAEVSDWAMAFAKQHATESRIHSLRPNRDDVIESSHRYYQTSPFSPRRSVHASSSVYVDEARKDLEGGRYGSAALEALRAAFFHAEGR